NARNSASVMMLQRFFQHTQLGFGTSLRARDAGATDDQRHQRQSLPCRQAQPLRLKALKLIEESVQAPGPRRMRPGAHYTMGEAVLAAPRSAGAVFPVDSPGKVLFARKHRLAGMMLPHMCGLAG